MHRRNVCRAAPHSLAVPAGGGAPVVELTLTNDLTQGLFGLPAGDIRFVLSQLSPGSGGDSSEWQSYVTRDSGGIADAQAAIQGAQDILTERLAETPELRRLVRETTFGRGNSTISTSSVSRLIA